MTGSAPDQELLDAFAPEFAAGVARLAAADAREAGRALDGLRAMAEALGASDFKAEFEAAAKALEPFDGAALARCAASLLDRLQALREGDETPADANRAGLPAAGAGSRAPVRVLLVDDSAAARRLAAWALAGDERFAVVGEASDGEAGLALMRSLSPDLMLMDLEMPVLDGPGALRRWSLEGGARAVVVVSSAAPPGSALAARLRRMGASAVLDKLRSGTSGAMPAETREEWAARLLAAARRASGLAKVD